MTLPTTSFEQSSVESTTKSISTINPMQLFLLQVFTLAVLTAQLTSPVCANSHETLDEVALLQGNNDPSTDDATAQLLDEVKRSWQSLQGSWGKRDQSGVVAAVPEDYDAQVPEWTSSSGNEYSDHPEMLRYSVIYASSPNALAAAIAAGAAAPAPNGEIIEGDAPTSYEKRSWKNMNVAWGKRRSAVWNKFRGAWGKREPGWNNLKGMWGKRSTGDWKKLQSAWGKRSLQQ